MAQLSMEGRRSFTRVVAAVSKLWHAGKMGNKDKGRREVKKPKKKTPKAEPGRPAIAFVNKVSGSGPGPVS